MSGGIERLVDGGDLDELTRLVDRMCGAGEWDGLVELRDRCRAALERGRQLWPVASHAEYRLALEAPGRWAAGVLVAGAGRFALGPLPEVAASTHPWDELAPHVPDGPVGGLAAHERVVRGDDLAGDTRVGETGLDLPLALAPWEPDYPLAHYEAAKADFPAPASPPLAPVGLPAPGGEVAGDEGAHALVELAQAWTTESNGRAEAVAVRGDALSAVAALGVRRARVGDLGLAGAVAHLAWAGASGGAHGRRRGMATGRFGAWWALAALTGLLDEWPVAPAVLGAAAARLRWRAWDAGEPETGWALRLAAEDEGRGLAWAVNATDAV